MTMTNELKKPTSPVVIPAIADNEPCDAPGLGTPVPFYLTQGSYCLAVFTCRCQRQEQRVLAVFAFNLAGFMELNISESSIR